MSILKINLTLKMIKKDKDSMVYYYVEPVRGFKIGLKLVTKDENILVICE